MNTLINIQNPAIASVPLVTFILCRLGNSSNMLLIVLHIGGTYLIIVTSGTLAIAG